jgi:Ser/Thr protein kinase RdoA (MazF antagonist)
VSADTTTDELLSQALAAVPTGTWLSSGYTFEPVSGGTQATVWHGCPGSGADLPEVAVRLTPKPAALISRIAALINSVDGVECPHTLAVATLHTSNRTWTVHVCTWIGKGAAARSDPYGLGQDIARLHLQLSASGEDFTDRQLSFERGLIPSPEQELPAWYVARHLWRDRVLPQFAGHADQMPAQPIHGDLHWDNVVTADGGYGFIDFDKLMNASRAFDLAKLIATGFFRVGEKNDPVRFQRSRATDLLAGYQSISRLGEAELTAIEGFAVILNEEIARLGYTYDVPAYQQQAHAVGEWWTKRRRRDRHNPLGLRPSGPSGQHRTPAEQLAFFIDDL